MRIHSLFAHFAVSFGLQPHLLIGAFSSIGSTGLADMAHRVVLRCSYVHIHSRAHPNMMIVHSHSCLYSYPSMDAATLTWMRLLISAAPSVAPATAVNSFLRHRCASFRAHIRRSTMGLTAGDIHGGRGAQVHAGEESPGHSERPSSHDGRRCLVGVTDLSHLVSDC